MKRLIICGSALILMMFLGSCGKNFLNEEPIAELSSSQILDSANIEGVVIAAYQSLIGQYNDGSNAYNSPASNWSFGDVCSDDAYKGGGGIGDQNGIALMELFETNPSIVDILNKWLALYEGVHRTNLAIRLLNKSTNFSPASKEERIAEMRFLRGYFYFELKKIYNNIPYIDENDITPESYNVSNTQYTSDQIWAKIDSDFMAAGAVLPPTQTDLGRPTKWAAEALLCKSYIYQGKWQDAEAAADLIINSGQYILLPYYPDVFLPQNDNGPDVIFAIQYSINDGTPNNYNGSIGDRLDQPGGSFYALYGFHRPSQNLVNAFKTDAQGLPLEDNIKLQPSDYVDPRLDYTVGRQGIPYLDLGVNYDSSWEREVPTYGPYAPKKWIVSPKSSDQLKIWPYVNDLNFYIVRYADILLWKAEAAIELGDLETGRQYINMIRERAKNSKYIEKLDGSGYAANYKIDTYDQPFANQSQALLALRTEDRLEFAMEGDRFFDLVRWGVADSVLNNYFATESKVRSFLTGAKFVEGKNNYFPIPQQQVSLSNGKTTQNPGY